MAKEESDEAVKGGTPSRQGLYAIAAKYSAEAIKTLYDLMKNGKQEAIRMGAAKALLDKSLPDIKAVEVTGEDHGPIEILIVKDANNNNNE